MGESALSFLPGSVPAGNSSNHETRRGEGLRYKPACSPSSFLAFQNIRNGGASSHLPHTPNYPGSLCLIKKMELDGEFKSCPQLPASTSLSHLSVELPQPPLFCMPSSKKNNTEKDNPRVSRRTTLGNVFPQHPGRSGLIGSRGGSGSSAGK